MAQKHEGPTQQDDYEAFLAACDEAIDDIRKAKKRLTKKQARGILTPALAFAEKKVSEIEKKFPEAEFKRRIAVDALVNGNVPGQHTGIPESTAQKLAEFLIGKK